MTTRKGSELYHKVRKALNLLGRMLMHANGQENGAKAGIVPGGAEQLINMPNVQPFPGHPQTWTVA